jgi:hypothetical protein
MTVPKQWSPGEPITAFRLNEGIAESLLARKAIALGNGSSAVNEALGNQSANMRAPLLRLAIAVEDFTIPDGRTDLSVGPDDVPSGLCKFMRLNRNDSVHREENVNQTFRSWDTLGGLNNGGYRLAGEVFYVVFNQDSKRWEILQSATIRLIPAIVRGCLGYGWHEVEICDWNGQPDLTDESFSVSMSSSTSVSDAGRCDACSGVIQDGVCEDISDVDIDRDVGVGTGEIVWAHTTHLLPMMIGGMCKILKRTTTSSSSSVSTSGSISVSDAMIEDRIYDVVTPVFPIVALPFPKFECCTNEATGEQFVQMVSCTRVVTEGYECPGEIDPCPVGSTSESV